MNTSQIFALDPARRCEIERCDDAGNLYLCGLRPVTAWNREGIEVYLCRACEEWLRTLESLGREI